MKNSGITRPKGCGFSWSVHDKRFLWAMLHAKVVLPISLHVNVRDVIVLRVLLGVAAFFYEQC